MKLATALGLILREHSSATEKFKPFNSAHEGFAVIKEEIDELWDEVKKKSSNRNPRALEKEAVQCGAMILRFLTELTDSQEQS